MRKTFFMMLIALLTFVSCTSEDEVLELGLNENPDTVIIGPLNPALGTMLMKKMFIAIDLDAANTKDLANCLQTLGLKYKKWYGCLLDTIIGNPILKINQSEINVSGFYSSTDNTIIIADNQESKHPVYIEELLHAGQDRIYPGGIAQYADRGKPNIEFEVRVIKDLVGYINEEPYFAGSVEENSLEYMEWIQEVCGGVGHIYYGEFPSANRVTTLKYNDEGYYEFMKTFKEKYPQYNTPMINPFLPRFIQFMYVYANKN